MTVVDIPPKGVYTSCNKPETVIIEGVQPGMTGPPKFLKMSTTGRGWVKLETQDGDIGEFEIDRLMGGLQRVSTT